MLKKTMLLFVALLLLLAISFSSGFTQEITRLDQLNDNLVAVPKGTIADQLVWTTIPNAQVVYYDNVLECVRALEGGHVAAAAYDEPTIRILLPTHSDVVILPELITKDTYGFAVNHARTDLKAVMNDTIKELKTNGQLNDMEAFWFPLSMSVVPMPKILLDGTNGTLRFGTCAQVEPFSFKRDGEIVGFDIELVHYIARKLNMNVEIIDMDFMEMIPALLANKVDMIGACITISPERKKLVTFSEPYYYGGIVATVMK